MADLTEWVYLLVLALITAAFLYVATRLITKEELLDAPYALRLFVTAFVIVVLAWALRDFLPGALGILVVFLAMVVVIRYLVIEAVGLGDEWLEALLVSIVTLVFLYVVQLVLGVLDIPFKLFFLAAG